jgi:hypothetical protein
MASITNYELELAKIVNVADIYKDISFTQKHYIYALKAINTNLKKENNMLREELLKYDHSFNLEIDINTTINVKPEYYVYMKIHGLPKYGVFEQLKMKKIINILYNATASQSS